MRLITILGTGRRCVCVGVGVGVGGMDVGAMMMMK